MLWILLSTLSKLPTFLSTYNGVGTSTLVIFNPSYRPDTMFSC